MFKRTAFEISLNIINVFTVTGRAVNKRIAFFIFQCLFLLWCMAPFSWNGSQIIYTRVVRPFFLKHEAAFDNVVSDLSGKAKSAAESVAKEGKQ